MRTRRLVAVATLCTTFMLGGCGGEESVSEKSITLENTLGDDTFVTSGTATLTQDGDEIRLFVSAKRGNDEGNETPFLRATLDDGSTCESFRTYIWSDFTSFEDLMLECDATTTADDVTSATLTQ